MLERIGEHTVRGRSLYMIESHQLSDVALAPLPSACFACLIAWDVSAVDEAAIAQLAAAVLRAGAVYICAWGEGCERVHDIVDSEIHRMQGATSATAPIITTWHADDSLAHALWYLLYSATPNAAYAATCGASVAISIGSHAHADEIRKALLDPAEFSVSLMG